MSVAADPPGAMVAPPLIIVAFLGRALSKWEIIANQSQNIREITAKKARKIGFQPKYTQ
jgi:hypothetical protein